ncbi:MAG: riboflavin synthase, partial [Desulfobulbaceae bacterium]
LGDIHVGDRVNLERALCLSDRLGGHIVSGHVDCVATLKSRKAAGQYTLLSFSLPKEQSRYIVEKGSVAIDGISLTVNSCSPGGFSVSIIPHTLKMTTLNTLKVGGMVNIEVDVIGKYVEKLLGTQMFDAADQVNAGTRIDAGFLAEHGFFK